MFCGIELGSLLITAIIIAGLIAIIQLVFPKFPIFGGLIGQIVTIVLWMVVAILVVKSVIIPLLNCAGL